MTTGESVSVFPFDREAFVSVVAGCAAEWLDVDHPARCDAEEATLELENLFTPEAIVFAVNQQLSLLTVESLDAWSKTLAGRGGSTVGVLNPGNIPFSELQDFLAVLLAGHRYRGSLSSRSSALLPAFARAVVDAGGRFDARFMSFEDTLSRSDALIASGTDETMGMVRDRAQKQGKHAEDLLLNGHRFGVAVLDGQESAEERIGLAEDILLHEGLGCRSVAIVFAPAGHSPDPLLEAMATFRNTFPAHPESQRVLELQAAYLQAVDAAHAYGEGYEFLLSKGDPEVQRPPHVRWTEYAGLEEVRTWLAERKEQIQVVVASDRIRADVAGGPRGISPGSAQRPTLGWGPDGTRTAEFLRGL